MREFERERILGHSLYKQVVFLYPALKVKCSKDAVCDVCRKPWGSRLGHQNCVRTEHVKRAQCGDSQSLGSRVISGERKSWRLVKPDDVVDGVEYRCGNCGFGMEENCDEFVRHALHFCPAFKRDSDSEDCQTEETLAAKGKVWTMAEYRSLWRCFVISKLEGERDWKARFVAAWRGAGMRDVSEKSLDYRLGLVRTGGKLTRLERENIGRYVRREYAVTEVIDEEDEEVESSDGEEREEGEWDTEDELDFELGLFGVDHRHGPCDSDEDDCGLDSSSGEDSDGIDPVVVDPVVVGGRMVDRVVVERADVWESGDVVQPLTEEARDVVTRLREVYHSKKTLKVPSLKSRNQAEVKKEIRLVNGVVGNVARECKSITDVNHLLYASSFVVAERLGLTKKRTEGRKEKADPWWKRRIERNIEVWRKDLSRLTEYRRDRWKPSSSEEKRLNRVYGLKEKGAKEVCAFLKSKIHSGHIKCQKFLERKVQFHQNNLFRNNQSNLYAELNGKEDRGNAQAPKAKDATEFWSNIWSKPHSHDEEAEWLGRVRKKLARVEKQADVVIDVETVRAGVRRLSNWKAPGPDGVVGFWFKKLTTLHPFLAKELEVCLARGVVPPWMVKGRTVLIQKDPAKGTVASNYRPIACLPIMWKLLTGIFAEQIYDHLKDNNLLPDEQKGCRKRSRGTKDQLLIDKAITLDAKRRKRCLNMAWVDYKKAYDMVPHSWILEVVGMMGVADNVRNLLSCSMPNWKTMLTAGDKSLGTVEIRRGIFQGDSLSPLLFVMMMVPLTMILNDENSAKGYQIGNSGKSVNHLLFMDDLKLYAKNQDDIDALLGLVQEYSKDIGMEFGMDKCAVLGVRDGKRVECRGVVLPSGDEMKEVDEEGYKYLGVLQTEVDKNKDMKRKVSSEYMRRVKLLAKSKLYAGNLIRGINAWAVGVVRYSAGIIDWTKGDLSALDIKTRKTLSMCGAFHTRGNVTRLYLKRSDGGRGLISVEDCVRMEEANLARYIGESDEWMLKEVAEMGLVSGVETGEEYRKRRERERKEELRGKSLHGKYFREVEAVAEAGGVDRERSVQWLKAGFLTKATEGFIMAAQEQALRTKWVKSTIDKVEGEDGKCRVCGEWFETVKHIVSGCGQLAKKQYMIRHDKMGLRIHWELCRKYGIDCSSKWYNHVPSAVCSNPEDTIELHWDHTILIDVAVEHNKPDLVIVDKLKKLWTFVDFSVPWDANVKNKEDDKVDRYSVLAGGVRRLHHVKTKVIPIVIGALGTVPKRLPKYLEDLGIAEDVIGCLQTTALLGTQRILRSVMSI